MGYQTKLHSSPRARVVVCITKTEVPKPGDSITTGQIELPIRVVVAPTFVNCSALEGYGDPMTKREHITGRFYGTNR